QRPMRNPSGRRRPHRRWARHGCRAQRLCRGGGGMSASTSAPRAEQNMERYRRIRSVIEAPVLDRRKFAKLPSIPCDGVLIDMEDSVPLARKVEGRAAVLAELRKRE